MDHELAELYEWLQVRALQEIRAWYNNPQGKYSGNMVAKMGHTTWRFHTGGGWTEPELSWHINAKKPYRVTWLGVDAFGQHDNQARPELVPAVLELSRKLKQLSWHDSRTK